MDWSLGHYEHLAGRVRPAAEIVVGYLAPRPGEVVLDLGCGTGNAALIAASRGAQVTGVDPAPRLLEIARASAAAEGLCAGFVPGDGAHLPVPDGSVSAISSVFSVIWVPDPAAAAAEIARVLAPGGRIALSAWLRQGATAEQARLRAELVASVRGESPGPPLFAWHDPAALRELLALHGFSVETHDQALVFTGTSPAAYADAELADHPGWVEARELLEPAGRWDQARADLTQLYTEANEDPAAFRITSRYLVAVATK
ncbi:MAG: class I SAM-dependent methyltransferase [Actinomycetota bacterium]